MKNFQNYWHHLSERERWMLGVSILFVGVYLFYQLIYSPLSTRVRCSVNELVEKQEMLAWMQQTQSLWQQQKKPQRITHAKLLTLLANEHHNSSLQRFPYQLKQQGNDTLQLSYEQVPVNLFLRWFWTLSKGHGIDLGQFNAERAKTPGMVKLSLVITSAKNSNNPS